MMRLVAPCLVLVLALQGAAPALAGPRLLVQAVSPRRDEVVVYRGWPLRHRPPRVVTTHRPRVNLLVAPVVFLPLVAWNGDAVKSRPARNVLVWGEGETLVAAEGWTEFTMICNTRGTLLWLELPAGRVQFDWAEVVFENGETRVVDMKERTRGTGLFRLLALKEPRMVDHVRVVARARTRSARVVMRMEK